jgi:hypothetical protein
MLSLHFLSIISMKSIDYAGVLPDKRLGKRGLLSNRVLLKNQV